MSRMPGIFEFLGMTELFVIILFFIALVLLVRLVGRGKRLR